MAKKHSDSCMKWPERIVVDYAKIPSETSEWLKEIGALPCKSPMVCFRFDKGKAVMPYPYDYLVNTPLKDIKANKARHDSL